jgi:hypothetical protein
MREAGWSGADPPWRGSSGTRGAQQPTHEPPLPAYSRHRIPPSALSPKVTSAPLFSAPLFSVPSGRTQVSRVAIWRLQFAHCSGSCLMCAFYGLRVDAAPPGKAQCVRSVFLGWEEACV